MHKFGLIFLYCNSAEIVYNNKFIFLRMGIYAIYFSLLKVYCCQCVKHGLMDFSLSVFRLLQEQMEQSLSDTQHRLSVKMNELCAAHEQIEKLEERIGESGWTLYAVVLLLFFCGYLGA